MTDRSADGPSPSSPSQHPQGVRSWWQRVRRTLRAHRFPLVVFVVLTVLFMWPCIVHLRTRAVGAGDDSSVFLWASWWFPRAIGRLENPYISKMLFHPEGVDLSFNTNATLWSALSWPFARVLGLAGTANLFQVFAAFASAVGAYALAFRVTGDKAASLLAGIAFPFAPYRFYHAQGHFNLIHTEFLALGFYALVLLHDHPTKKRAIFLGAVLGLTFLTDVYYTMFLVIAAAIFAMWHWRLTLTRAMALRWLQVSAVAVVVAVPLLLPMANAYREGGVDEAPKLGGAEAYSADVVSWLLPPPSHPVAGPWTEAAWAEARINREGLAYPGLIVLVLAGVGAFVGATRARPVWLLIAGVTAVLSFGPFLHVNGWTGSRFEYLGFRFSVPLPFLAFHKIPFLGFIRAPGRFAIPAILALAILAAGAMAWIRRRFPRAANIALVVVVAFMLFEFLPGPLPTHDARPPAPYRAIAADPDTRAVLEIPLQWKSAFVEYGERTPGVDHSLAMYYATFHGKPIVGGYVSYYPADRFERLLANDVYRQIMALQGDQFFRREAGYGDHPATFTLGDVQSTGIGFVVCHRDMMVAAKACGYVEELGLPVLASDRSVIVWKVPAATG